MTDATLSSALNVCKQRQLCRRGLSNIRDIYRGVNTWCDMIVAEERWGCFTPWYRTMFQMLINLEECPIEISVVTH